MGFTNLHPFRGTHLVLYINGNCFDIYGCSLPQKLSKILEELNGRCLSSEYKTQVITNKNDFHCASYCLYTNHLTKDIVIVFKSSFLSLYYQMIQEH